MQARIWVAGALVALAGCGQPVGQAGAPTAAEANADLRHAVSDPRVARFYETRGWQSAWTRETESALVAAIGEAERHALDKDAFLGPIQQAPTGAAHDAALSLAALSYAEALARGRTDPARLRAVYTVPRPDPNLAAGLAGALRAGNVGDWLRGLAPQDEEYRALSDAYLATNQEIAAATQQPEGSPQRRRAAPAIDRARTLAVNLERRRWLERTPPATRIDVNTAAATLAYLRDGRVADVRRTVVGDPEHQTPQLGSPLFRLAANPTWTVPHSIEQAEIVPKGEAYMRRNNMEWRDGSIVQKSGPRNSLGLVKFDMRNDQQIYLHDTPAKALFSRSERHESHGCVRVDDALGFARLIAADQGVLEAWEDAQEKDEESFVTLPHPIPVRLLYQTAFIDNGRVVFVPDVYSWDEDVAEALGLPARPRRAAAARHGDVGP
ncbi:MAG TPA: L,D-transpeptidase family protein [Allosphingosinicella sp.]|nr:L,D-transpeptidase family protein [Allosphingosinicella sp.]